ncbi:alpha-2-macroglobulin family protein [Leptospira ryugenii]|uniref:Alpha-2-macroglobulin family protein n=2 Tax=Leptospira ryugenii TaxID=1917863 RepID=A0A2P2DVP6_9LEPT|nr:alpha-2-macroglobulin family protein [Leptospira ryugenii]
MKFRKISRLSSFLFCFLLFVHQSDSQSNGLSIELFSPTEFTKQVKQVQVRFSEPMVSLGDPRPKEDLFDIDCPLPGKARWLDSLTWVYEFEQELPGGVVCKFRAKQTVLSLKGKALVGQKEFGFHTGGPSIQYTHPYSGNSVDEDQYFVLQLDAEPVIDTVLKYAFFYLPELNSQIGIEMVGKKERELALKSHGFTNDAKTLVIKAKQNFLPEKPIQLVWGKGIKAKLGGEVSQEEVHQFTVRPAFSVNFSCERVNAKANCIPILPMSLSFNASVLRKDLQKISLRGADGTMYPSSVSKEVPGEEGSFYVSFAGPFPESSEFTIEIPNELRDEMGRKLANQESFPLKVKTGEFPPLAKFAAQFGILESKANPALPVTVRNLEAQLPLKKLGLVVNAASQKSLDPLEIMKMFQAMSKHKREQSIFAKKLFKDNPENQTLPKPNGKKPMEVVGIPLPGPGFYLFELSSDVLGNNLLEKKGKMYVISSALVTNLSIHFKWGGESSLVWVTSLDKAEPEALAIVKVMDCKGNIRANGVTNKDGIFKFGKIVGEIPYCGYHELGSGLTIFAEKSGDISFASSNWDKGIEAWRYNLPSYSYHDGSEVQTVVLDRTLFRSGETVHLKHIRRSHSIQGLLASDPNRYPKKVVISHEASGEKFSSPLVWSFPGSAESEFQIPKKAKLGTYRVYYPASMDDDSYGETVASFKVEEFRLPVLKGGIQVITDKAHLVSPNQIKLDLNLQYLSGGGAANHPIKLRAQINPSYFRVKDEYENFHFQPEKIEVGKVRLSSYEEETEERTETKNELKTESFNLDEKGFLSHTYKDLGPWEEEKHFDVEMEYLDPNGEIQTIARRFEVHANDVRLGIQPKGWMFTKEKVEMQILAIDLDQKPKRNQKILVKAYSQVYYSNRKRLVGGYYAYEHYREVKDLGNFCQGKTNEQGILFCEGKAPTSGEVLFVAETEDDRGKKTNSGYSVYVADSEEIWFEASDHNRMDILPEKNHAEIGEVLKVQLRSPFREANALVTIEREGVIDSMIVPVSGKDPVIQIPIKKEYAPNIYISVLLLRGRVGEPKPTGLVDLAKPSFRLGLAPVQVGWKPFQLQVQVETEKNQYKVRDSVTAKIQVKDSLGRIPKAGGEILVAVVDEALLELSPNPTWNLIEKMMGLRGHDVSTATAQSQIIGKRHFGLKAKPPGGGGGKSPTRSLFNTLVFWKGKVLLDKDGKASVSFPLNDSLTSFKIVAVASSGVYEFGTGTKSIQTNQNIQSFSSLPEVVREGDRFQHEFTLRNAGEESQAVKVILSVVDTNLGTGKKSEAKKESQEETLLPGSTKPFVWLWEVPKGIQEREFLLEVKDTSGQILDKLSIKQKVQPVLKESVFMAGFQQWETKIQETLKSPEDAEGESNFKVSVSPTLFGNFKTVESYFQTYPYHCLEQRISQAIGLKDKNRWSSIDDELSSYLDENGLAKFFPSMNHGSELLTAYVLTSAKLAGYEWKPEVSQRMLEGLNGYLGGYVPGEPWSFGADTILRRIIVTEAISRYHVLKWDQVSSLANQIELLPTSSLVDLSEILSRTENVNPTVKSRLANALRNRLNLQGSEMGIADQNFPSPWWILGSKDYTSARLLIWTLREPSYERDRSRLVKGLLKRQIRGRWDTTLGNAYAVLALGMAAKLLESEKVESGFLKLRESNREIALDPNKRDSVSIAVKSQEKSLEIDYDGKGKPWVFWQASSKIPLKKPLNAGYSVNRTIQAVSQKTEGKFTRGDVIRIRLEIQADSDKTWVVLEDPIPSGSIHMGRGLSRESKMLESGSISQVDTVSPSWEERTFSLYRAYFEYLPQGKHTIEYQIRLGQAGSYSLPNVRVEAMYSPEVFSESPVPAMQILP